MRLLLIISGAFAGLLVVCCLLGIFVAIPRARDEAQEEVQEAIATEIARQIPAIPGIGAEPGTYTITAASLEASLRENSDNDDDLTVEITPEGMSFGVVTSGQDAVYSGVPAAENGAFVMHDMETNSGFLKWVLSPDSVGEAISAGINGYLSENNLQLESLELQDGQMVLTTVPATE